MILPIILVAGSFAFLILEVFFVSFGMLAVIALTLGVAGVVFAFDHSATYGWVMIASLVLGGPIVIRLAFQILPKLPFAKGFYLKPPPSEELGRRSRQTHLTDLRGEVGTATSALRPAGSVLIGDQPVQVVTTGMRIERGSRVRVVEVNGNRVVVEPADAPKTI